MNLWARRIGLTVLSALLLFFLGCEDPLSNLGFRNPNQKFLVKFVEIDVPASVLMVDSVPTMHDFSQQGGPQDIYRLMVGAFNSPTFGNTVSTGYTQYRPGQTGITFDESAVFDSLILKMRLDFYTTGSTNDGPLRINIYEITEEIQPNQRYFNNSQPSIGVELLGQVDFIVEPDIYNAFVEAQKDTVIQIKAALSQNLGMRLFEAAKVGDSIFNQYQYFRKEFKGIALVPEQAEHVVGLSIANPNSVIEMHYHDVADTLKLDFYFDAVVGFSNHSVDRGATALSGLNNFFTEFTPSDNRLYVQGGTGLVTKLDFSKFLEFADTVPDIVLNSAELVFENIEKAANVSLPRELKLKVLRPNNRFRGLENKQDSTVLPLYRLGLGAPNNTDRVWYDLDLSFLIGGDNLSGAAIMSPKSNNSYQTFITLFLQRLMEIKEPENQFTNAAVYVSRPVFGKSLDGFSFPKENLKLRIYYTKPVNL